MEFANRALLGEEMWKMNQFAKALKTMLKDRSGDKSEKSLRTMESISNDPVYHTVGSLKSLRSLRSLASY